VWTAEPLTAHSELETTPWLLQQLGQISLSAFSHWLRLKPRYVIIASTELNGSNNQMPFGMPASCRFITFQSS